MKNTYCIISYVNYELKLMVYNTFENKPYLLFEELIVKEDLLQLKSDFERDKITNKLKQAVRNAPKINSENKVQVYLLFDPKEHYLIDKNFTFEYDETHTITNNDIMKATKHAMYEEIVKDGFKSLNFQIKEMTVDGKSVNNPLGYSVKKFTIAGQVIISDAESYYTLMGLINDSSLEIIETYIGNNVIKNNINLKDKTGYIEVGTREMHFTFNNSGEYFQTTLDIGMENIMMDLFQKLMEELSSTQSEQAVRFIMQYMVIEEYKHDFEIIEGVSLNYIIRLLQDILIRNFQSIYMEFSNSGINMESMQMIIHEYPQEEIADLLSRTLDKEFVAPKELKVTIKENFKAYCLIKMISNQKITTVKEK